jgi:hypothetical protein
MKTPAMLHPSRKHGRLRRLESAASLLRRAASRGRPKHGGSHGSRVRDALPRMTGGAIGRLGGRRR